MNDWYLGPLGELRALPVPEPGLEVTTVRYGGTHQALSGARIQDTTGRRNEYKFEFTYMDQEEYYWLEAMHTGHIPGPYRLIDPLKKNRFNMRSTAMVRVAGMEDVLTYDRSWPSQVPIPGRSYVLSGWDTSSYTLAFEDKTGTAVFPNEQVTASIYARCNSAHSATLVMQMCNADLQVIETQSIPINITTDWQRFAMTRTVPTDCAAVKFRLLLGSANTAVYLAASQFESGPIATEWEPGGGAPVVVIDSLVTASPRYPLRDASLSLLEV